MNEDTTKGTLGKIAGKLKENIGSLIHDEDLKNEGKLDQVKGSAQESLGHAKDAGRAVGEGLGKATE